MSRLIFLGVIFGAIVGTFLLIWTSKESYKMLPIEEAKQFDPKGYDTWNEFHAPSGQFSVLLPVMPQNAKHQVTDPKTQELRSYDMYVAEKIDGTVFMINLISFPNESAARLSNANLLTKMMNDMIESNPQNKLDTMEMGTFHGYDALDFSIESNGTDVITAKAFVVDKTLYVLTMVSKKGKQNPVDFNMFVNSFELEEK